MALTNAQLAERIDGLGKLFKVELSGAEQRLNGRIDGLAQHVDRQNGRLGKAESRVGVLESAKVGTDAVAAALKERDEEMQGRIALKLNRRQTIYVSLGSAAACLAAVGGLIEIIHHA